MSTPPVTAKSTVEVGVRLPDGRVAEVHRADEVLDATLTGREYAERRARVLRGHVVERTVTVTTLVGRWERPA